MIEPLAARDRDAAAIVLARAFRDNPGTCAVLKGADEDERYRILGRTMPSFTDGVLRYGAPEIARVDGTIQAVSLVLPPGKYPMPILGQLRMLVGPLTAATRHAGRFIRIDAMLQHRHLKGPHYYLWFLGVDAERQGQGLGSELLRSLAGKADRDRVPCYLETDRRTSVRLYEKHGFRVVREEQMAGLDLTLWFMVRGNG